MAFWKDLFGYPEKRDTTYRGPKPIGLLDRPEGKKLKGTLEERLAGRGVGFRPEFLEKATTPYAAQRRAGLQEETIPQISAQASARGLGRSTIPVQRIGLESMRTERDVSEYVGKISLMDEQQRRLEINDALTKYQQMTGDIVSGENLKSQFEHADYLQQLGRADEANAMRTKALQQIAMTVGGAVAGASGGPVGMAAGATAGMSSGAGMGGAEAYLQKLMNAAMVTK